MMKFSEFKRLREESVMLCSKPPALIQLQ